MLIECVRLCEVDLPFDKPYGGSDSPLSSLTTVLAEVISSEGRSGWGEAAVYTGYTHESLKDAKLFWVETAELLIGKNFTEALKLLPAYYRSFPFAVTVFLSAIEMLVDHPVLRPPRSIEKIPLLAALYSREVDGIPDEIEEIITAGYKTVKIKLGANIDHELTRVRKAQEAGNGRILLRLDANQKYSRSEAIKFVEGLDSEMIELLEQPCSEDDWESAIEVRKAASVPLMLDESIYGPEDIVKTAELAAADYVKLKLMKFSTIDRTMDGLSMAGKLGLRTVLGNGVSSDIGCWMEACIARFAMNNDGEMNGFLKPDVSVFENPLPYKNGSIVLSPDYTPIVNRQILNDFATWKQEISG